MCLRALVLLVASLLLCAVAYSSEAKVEELLATTEGQNTYFRVRLAEPPDLLQNTDSDRRLQQVFQALRAPRLASLPPWETPCYPVGQGTARGDLSTLSFIGCAKSGPKPELTLTYQRAGGGWSTARVALDLSRAGKLGDSGTDDSRRTPRQPSPAQQFATAQSEWLQTLEHEVRDPAGFLTYARLRLARKAGILETRDFSSRGGFGSGPEFLGSEMSYDTLSGARAVQESLQVDRALAGSGSDTTAPRTVSVSDIPGITVRAHPYDQMRRGRNPRVHPLAHLVPGDQYFLWFRSLAKLQELADFMQDWGETGLETANASDGARGVRERIQRQLCLPATLLSKVMGPALVKMSPSPAPTRSCVKAPTSPSYSTRRRRMSSGKRWTPAGTLLPRITRVPSVTRSRRPVCGSNPWCQRIGRSVRSARSTEASRSTRTPCLQWSGFWR